MSCFFGHKWTNWTVIRVKNTRSEIFQMQERKCTRCGLTKRQNFF